MPDLSDETDLSPLVDGVDAVIHLAGIAHARASDAAYEAINHRATAALAAAARAANVKRFVFVSSILAQSGSSADHVLTENDTPSPQNAYGKSKLAAEQAVRASGVPFAILRPVVVYGAGAKGNFAAIKKLSSLPLPLPFGALENRRSVLSIDNFNTAILTLMTAPAALGETFIAANPEPVTIGQIVGGHPPQPQPAAKFAAGAHRAYRAPFASAGSGRPVGAAGRFARGKSGKAHEIGVGAAQRD